MYTFTFTHSRTIRRFYKEGDHEIGTPLGLKEGSDMTSEAQKKIQEFAQKVVDTFENNPEKKQAFLASLDGMKQSVFSDPVMFRAFLTRAYEQHEIAMNALQGGERTKKIQQFSVFITDVMLQFAEMNGISELQQAIKTKQKNLEIKYGELKMTTQTNLSDLQKSLG